MNRGGVKGGMKRRLFFLKHKLFFEWMTFIYITTTTKNQTENESGMIRISAHPEAEKPEGSTTKHHKHT